MSERYQVVVAHPSSVRPRRVTYRETTSGGNSYQVDVYTRRSSQRVVYTHTNGDYELYSSSYRRRVYYY